MKVLHGIHKVVALAGSQHALARQLGVSQMAVFKWVKHGCVPPGRCVEIEAQYGVSRRELLEPRFIDLLDTPLEEG
jgi:DNA-binding transcriptional regulator YdaS (Cro superfamily)